MDTSEIKVRQLSRNDAALYREMRLEALQNNPEAFTSSYEDESPQPLSAFEQTISNSTIFVAFDDKEALGIAALTGQQGRRKAHKGAIWSVYVRARARNMGIGRKLLETIIAYAHERFELLQLNVNSQNESARHLYENCGFFQYGIEQYAVKDGDNYIDNVLMMKFLKSQAAKIG